MNRNRRESSDSCPVCGSIGRLEYVGLRDVLYSVPGNWQLAFCTTEDCRHGWIDPEPDTDQITAFYRSYYTHDHPSVSRYGIEATKGLGLKTGFMQWLYRMSGVIRARASLETLGGDSPTKGSVLDVGCGNGSRLLKYKELGWQIYGQDVDPSAASAASEATNAAIHLGEIQELVEQPKRFDLVLLYHVLEHTSNPQQILKTCRELIKPSGEIVAVVPNYASLTSRIYGQHWRGLEPPRHLQHFNRRSLKNLSRLAGLEKCRVSTTAINAEAFVRGSLMIRRAAEKQAGSAATAIFSTLKAHSIQVLALALNAIYGNLGDECILRWNKSQ